MFKIKLLQIYRHDGKKIGRFYLAILFLAVLCTCNTQEVMPNKNNVTKQTSKGNSKQELKQIIDKRLKELSDDNYFVRNKAYNELKLLLKESGENEELVVEYLKKAKETCELHVNEQITRILKWFFDPYWNKAQKIHVLEGHTESVNAVAFNAKANLLVSGSTDKTIRIWDTKNGRCMNVLKGHSATVRSVAFSPDSKYIVSASDDQTINIWNAKTGDLVRTIRDHKAIITSIVFRGDGELLLSAGSDGTIRVWDFTTGTCLKTFEGEEGFTCVACQKDGPLIAASDFNGFIYIWNINTEKLIKVFKAHDDVIRSIDWSTKGDLLVSVNDDETVRIWNTETWKNVRILNPPRKSLVNTVSVRFAPDGMTTIVSFSCGSVQAWRTYSGIWIGELEAGSGLILSVVFSTDGRMLATASGKEHLLEGKNKISRSITPLGNNNIIIWKVPEQ